MPKRSTHVRTPKRRIAKEKTLGEDAQPYLVNETPPDGPFRFIDLFCGIGGFHRPAAFVIENVKNLKGQDGGKTFDIIYRTLTEALGYTVYHKIIDAQSVVPQHRERIIFGAN